MTAWTSDELDKIGKAEELQIASLRRDSTLRIPVTIWVVRLGDHIFVRSWRGRSGSWFRAAQVRHEGRIWGAGVGLEQMDIRAYLPTPDISHRTKYYSVDRFQYDAEHDQYICPQGQVLRDVFATFQQ